MKDATKLVMKKTLQQECQGKREKSGLYPTRSPCVRFNSSLSLRGHRSYLIIKPSYFSFCLLMRRERKRRREERVCALYLTSKGSPANNELYFSFIFFFVVKQKKFYFRRRRRRKIKPRLFRSIFQKTIKKNLLRFNQHSDLYVLSCCNAHENI